MTEAEWLTEDDLEYLLDFFEEKASRRKLRLFVVGRVRGILHLVPDQTCRTAVEVAEAFADGRTSLDALTAVYHASEREANTAWYNTARSASGGVFYFATRQDALSCDFLGVAHAITKEEFDEVSARDAIDDIVGVLAHVAIPPDQWETSAGDDAAMRAVEYERPKQLHLFRDVFGNPFRPVSVNTRWLAWNDGVVLKLAQGIYEDRAFDRLPFLADALEEAGCDNADILAHCRQPGPHVRGCWVIDLLLGKE
jgi:hypothetical protein